MSSKRKNKVIAAPTPSAMPSVPLGTPSPQPTPIGLLAERPANPIMLPLVSQVVVPIKTEQGHSEALKIPNVQVDPAAQLRLLAGSKPDSLRESLAGSVSR